jgi:TatD DNase family protein
MIFDTHTHYDDEAFNEDREKLIDEISRSEIRKIVNVGANLATSQNSVDLSEKYDFFYAAVGVHPDDAAEVTDEGIERLRELAKGKKVVAVGEIGLDYYWNKENSDLQKTAFKRQIEFARELSLPIIVHSRDAAADTMDILHETDAGKLGGVIHCFSYSPEIALESVKIGFYIGIGGVVTFKNAKKIKESVEAIPLEKIVLETDCPYLAPDPFRGKRNSSLYLEYVVKEIARLKGIDEETVIEQTYKNALNMYKIEA